MDITCLSYESGCQIFSKYVNGDFTHYEYTDVPHWFLRLFGDDLIEEFTARRVSGVVAGIGLQMLSELEHIKGIDWEYLKFCASDYNDWRDLAPCVQDKINSKSA